MPTALVSLGSNLGDRAATLRQALEVLALHEAVRVTAISSFHETAPVGGPAAQEKFLNAAAVVETSLPPPELFSILQVVENQFGRVRDQRWGPRTIDLDLLLYDQLELDSPELTLPHPRMSFRRFVLEPAAEIAAEMVHPVCGNTIAGLLRHLDATPRLIVTNLPVMGSVLLDLDRIHWLSWDAMKADETTLFMRPYKKALEQWEASDRERILESLEALPLHEWAITYWSQLAWACHQVDISKSGDNISTRYGPTLILPRLFIVGEPDPISDLLNCDVFKLLRQTLIGHDYCGPVLRLKDCTSDQLRDEVLAAIAAME